MYCVYLGLMLAALNRLPLRLPNQKGPGRRHKAGGEGERPATTFADVAGVDEAKEELAELVDYLKAPERFMKLGARPPSGVLLVGPPGTGKTLLAKAVAGEAGVPFFSIAASEFVELYVGVGALRVRELFAAARKEAPAIVFIDEIDAVAKGRDSRMRGAGNDEREQTLNQLLTELDGFDSDKDGGGAVICLAATNRAEVLDPALLRPGRFDRRVPVERPDRQGRTQILQVHLSRRGLPLAPDVSVSGLAASTTGFTGADLANLVNEAALLAGRHSRSQVTAADFDAAVMRAVAGLEKKRGIMVAAEREVVARHEAGHALAASAVQQLLPLTAAGVERLSIIPRSGGALGFTYMPPKTEDRALLFDSEIRGQLVVLMGGRAAEQLTCTAVSTGAADDIRRATDLAQRAVSEFGLSLAVGPLNVGVLAAGGAEDAGLWGALGNSGGGGVPGLVETEVKALLDEALSCALDVIRVNASAHDGLSRALSSAERLEGPELARWLDQVAVPDSLRSFVQSRGVGQNASFTAKLQAQQS
ncbi:ATP-dependent metallopeptidase Hfl [Haematococcus lacustris]